MYRTIYIIILLNIFLCAVISAQEWQRDSLWIKNTISEGGDIQLNTETMEAIRRGAFLNTLQLPLEKDFGLTFPENGRFDGLQLLHLSPTETLIFQYITDSLMIVKSARMLDPKNLIVREYFTIPHTPIETRVAYSDDFREIDWDAKVWEGEWPGSIYIPSHINFSAEDILEDMFSPEERHKDQNRNKAKAWKYYNLEEMGD